MWSSMLVSTINVISRGGQAYSHKNVKLGMAAEPAVRSLFRFGKNSRRESFRAWVTPFYLFPKKELRLSSAPASGLSASAITWR